MSRKNLECIGILIGFIVIAAILLYANSWLITAQETLIQSIGRGWWTSIVLVIVIFFAVRSK